MNTKLIHHQYHSGISAPPQDGLVLVEPGENAFRVSLLQSCSAQVIPRAEQSRSWSTLVPSACRVWERLIVLNPRKGLSGYALQNDASANRIRVVRIVSSRSVFSGVLDSIESST